MNCLLEGFPVIRFDSGCQKMCPGKEKYCGAVVGGGRIGPYLPQLLHGVVQGQPGPDVGAVDVGLARPIPGVGAIDRHVELQVLSGHTLQAKVEQK